MGKDDKAPSKLCFVIGPIGAENSDVRVHADWLLDGIIVPVMAEYPEFRVRRADRDFRPGPIDAQMIRDLHEADLVIADLSLLNPNAFYEIGIRHMLQKPIIHMQLVTEAPPFDVSLYRALKFSTKQHSEVMKARADLREMVKAILDPGYVVENPVTQARGQVLLTQHATPAEQVLLTRVEALEDEIKRLRPKKRKEQLFTPSHFANLQLLSQGNGRPDYRIDLDGGESADAKSVADAIMRLAAKYDGIARIRIAGPGQLEADVELYGALNKE